MDIKNRITKKMYTTLLEYAFDKCDALAVTLWNDQRSGKEYDLAIKAFERKFKNDILNCILL
jgi:hypothetical protein